MPSVGRRSGLHGLVLLQPIKVLREQETRCLLGVVQLRGAAGLLPEDVVDILEGLLEHGCFRDAGPSGSDGAKVTNVPHLALNLLAVAQKPRRDGQAVVAKGLRQWSQVPIFQG